MAFFITSINFDHKQILKFTTFHSRKYRDVLLRRFPVACRCQIVASYWKKDLRGKRRDVLKLALKIIKDTSKRYEIVVHDSYIQVYGTAVIFIFILPS